MLQYTLGMEHLLHWFLESNCWFVKLGCLVIPLCDHVMLAHTSTDLPRSAFELDSVFISRRRIHTASYITGDALDTRVGYIDKKKEQSQFGTTR